MDLAFRPVVLAAELVRRGADLVVVGGAARLLRSCSGRPRDLDVVVDAAAVAGLVAALAELGVTACAASLLRCQTLRMDTAWGPLDVFVADRPPSSRVEVGGVPVAVLKG